MSWEMLDLWETETEKKNEKTEAQNPTWKEKEKPKEDTFSLTHLGITPAQEEIVNRSNMKEMTLRLCRWKNWLDKEPKIVNRGEKK